MIRVLKILYYIFIWIIRVLCVLVFKIFYFFKVENANNFPRNGGLIVMANHSSYFDPPLIGSSCWKRMFKFMARSSLFIPVFGNLLRWMGAFPVKLGVIDRSSYEIFINYIKQGEAIVFFPEGTRSKDGNIQQGKPGTGMLVYKSKAKVLPVYIHNAWKAWPKGKFPRLFVPVTVVVGEIMDFSEYFLKPPSKEIYIEITDRIIERIKDMQRQYLLKEGIKK